MNAHEVSSELAEALRRYLAIQEEERRLQEEKAALQETLGRHLSALGLAHWYPEVDGVPLKVRCQETAQIEYDEELLRQRLGDRFASILAPDIRKIRRWLPQIQSVFLPILGTIGSPSPDRVRAAVEQGVVRKEEFAGAFKKTTRRLVAVAKVRPGDAEGPGGEPAPAPAGAEG